MGVVRRLRLSQEERLALIRIRDLAPKPFERERAAALLKVAEGYSVQEVARSRLLRPRAPSTVSGWLDRYQEGGIDLLLKILPGRGRKPSFSPSVPRRGRHQGGDASPGAPRPSALRHRGHPLDPGGHPPGL